MSMTLSVRARTENTSHFNNGKSQAQSWDIGLTNDVTFMNWMLQADAWGYNDNQGNPLPSELDANGYPIATGAHMGYKCTINMPPAGAYGSGTLVLAWDGNGTLFIASQYGGIVTTVSGSLTSTTGSGRYVFTTTIATAIIVGISSVGSPIITNIKLYDLNDEAALNSGQIFGAPFLNVIRQGNPGVLRFLDWGASNNTNVTTWATRKPTTYFSYLADELRASLYAGTTTSCGLKYAVTFGSGGPTDKQTIHVNFNPLSISGITIGPNATVTTSAVHGFNVGQPLAFAAPYPSALPSMISKSYPGPNGRVNVYYVTSVPTSTTFTFSGTNGGTNVDTTGGMLSGTPNCFATISSQTVSYSNSGSEDVVTWANHGLNVGDAVSIQSSHSYGMPSPLYNSLIYWVIGSGFTTGSFQFSRTPGGAAVSTSGSSFSGTISASAVPMLNLNGAGAAPLLAQWGDPNTSLGAPFGGTSTATLVYDADLGGWLQFGGNAGDGSIGLRNKVPREIMVELCKEVGAHPHFPAPYLACDPMTDWHTQLASYVKNNGPAWMKPRFEGTNETWNPSLGFNATRYAWNKEPAHWGLSYYLEDHNWYGMIVSKIGQAINAVYGGTPSTQTNYAVICGIQTVTALPSPSSNDPRLTCAAWIAAGSPAQSGYVISEAYNWATDVCVANYWTPGEYYTPQEMINAFNWTVTNNGNSSAQAAIATSYLNTANSGCVFTGSLSAGALTVTAVSNGQLSVGSIIQNLGSSVTSNTKITSFGTGTGGTGTYNVTNTQTLASGELFTDGSINGSQASQFNLVTGKRYATQALQWAQGLGGGLVSKMCGYEGGYSPDYPANDTNINSSITAITNATSAVVTIGTFNTVGQAGTGSAAVVGMPIRISGVGGMTQINTENNGSVTVNAGKPGTVTFTNHGFNVGQAIFFEPVNNFGSALPSGVIFGQAYYVQSIIDANTFTVSATSGGSAINITGTQVQGVYCYPCWVVTAVSGNNVTLNVNSSTFGTYTSGGELIYGAAQYCLIQLRQAAKFSATIEGYTTQLYNDFVSVGGHFPSCYFISGSTTVWGVWDPNIFLSSIPPQWAAVAVFNQ